MSRLVVAITRPHPQAIVGVILAFPNEFRGNGMIMDRPVNDSELSVYSSNSPLVLDHTLYAWGRSRKDDGNPFVMSFPSSAKCDEWLARLVRTVKSFNEQFAHVPSVINPLVNGIIIK